MSRKKRMSIGRAPLTTREIDGEMRPKDSEGKPIACSKCGKSGGTLVKQGDGYVHQNKELCKILVGGK